MGGAAVARVRLAAAHDADAIGRVQVAAWRQAYAHFLLASFLDGLDGAERLRRYLPR